ncbi:MAG: translation initiation factor IF-5A [Acidilobaceae archaeon]|nr:translation initiation factor IF-5A [Acidilobaceae archaeon]MCX8165755.1 translation initiation factor IF-5A [Acidilobaceae archaeon]MDW7974180.1 translation initiation factor IF-5A [Sulfolobales archaeon]
MSYSYASLGDLRKGSYVIIDGEPCRIVEYSTAKTGKHGSAKAHVVAVSVFTGQKKTLVAPVDTKVQVPIIEKRVGQVIADLGNNVQVLDMETYETLEMSKPTDEPQLAEALKPGVNIEFWVILGKPLIVRLRS